MKESRRHRPNPAGPLARLPVLPARLAALFAACLSLNAAAYDIDLEREIEGTQVTVAASGGPNAKVVINNRGKATAHCRVEFQAGKGANAVRVGSVRPGKRVILTAPMPPDLDKLRIQVGCKPPKGPAESPAR